SELCHWQIPQAHFLETWSDARAYDGTVSIVQPLIAPLYAGKSAHEVVAAMTDQPEQPAYEIVRTYWKPRISSLRAPSRSGPGRREEPGAPPSSDGTTAPTPANAQFESAW